MPWPPTATARTTARTTAAAAESVQCPPAPPRRSPMTLRPDQAECDRSVRCSKPRSPGSCGWAGRKNVPLGFSAAGRVDQLPGSAPLLLAFEEPMRTLISPGIGAAQTRWRPIALRWNTANLVGHPQDPAVACGTPIKRRPSRRLFRPAGFLPSDPLNGRLTGLARRFPSPSCSYRGSRSSEQRAGRDRDVLLLLDHHPRHDDEAIDRRATRCSPLRDGLGSVADEHAEPREGPGPGIDLSSAGRVAPGTVG